MTDQTSTLPNSVSRPALLHDGTDARFRQMVSDLFTVSVRMQAVRDALAKDMGVSGPQYSMLMAIARLGDGQGATVNQVAEQLHVTGAFVTVETGKLVGSGLIEKSKNPDDGRSVLLRLTSAGVKLLDQIAPKVSDVNDRFFGSLDREDFATLSRVAVELVQDADAALERAREPMPTSTAVIGNSTSAFRSI